MADNLTPITSDQLSKVTTAQDTDLVTLGINGNFVSMTLANLKEVLGINALNTKSQWRAQNTTGTNVITIPSEANEAVVFVFEESRSVSYTYFLPKSLLAGQNITISQGYGWSDAENKNACQILVGLNKVNVEALYNAGTDFTAACVMDVYWR